MEELATDPGTRLVDDYAECGEVEQGMVEIRQCERDGNGQGAVCFGHELPG